MNEHEKIMPITLNQVDVTLNGVSILSDLNLHLAEQRIGVIGANGAGKSTFARLLNGLILPSRGTVTVDGLETAKAKKITLQKVGLVLQNPEHQIILPIVEEDLAFSLKARGLKKSEVQQKVDEILAHYNLSHLKQRATYTLSGGQKQLLAIASVLINAPDVIVFDEPTTLLDHRNKRQIQRVITALPQAVVVLTHDFALLEDFERVIVLDAGKVIADAKPQQAIDFYLDHLNEQ